MNEIPYYHVRHRTFVAIYPSVWRTRHYLRGSYVDHKEVGYDEIWYIRSIVARNLPTGRIPHGPSTAPPGPEPHYQVQIRASTWREVVDVYLYGSEEWKFDPPLLAMANESITITGLGYGFEEDGREINLYVHFIRCTGPDAKKPLPQMAGSVRNAIDEEELKKVVEGQVSKSFRLYLEGMWDEP
jgi:hypothetical protein